MIEDRDREFGEFLAGSGRQLLQTARLLAGDYHGGEDLLQAVLTKTYLRWKRVRIDDPHAYVRQALVNGARDRWRFRRWREVPLDHADVGDSRFTTGGDETTHAERDSILRALSELTRRERQVVVLRYYEDLSESDIARITGIAPGTVKSTAARGLAKLAVSPHLTAPRGVST